MVRRIDDRLEYLSKTGCLCVHVYEGPCQPLTDMVLLHNVGRGKVYNYLGGKVTPPS